MGAQSFPRAARLLRAADFAALRQRGRRVSSQFFSAEYLGVTDLARLGLAVSKRVSKRAVERNRIKRLARDSFRRHRSGLPAFDILLVPRTSAAGVDGTELLADLEKLWSRLAALKPQDTPGTMRG